MQKELRLWKIYSTVTTLLIAVLALSGFQPQERRAKFSEIDVERINIVEKSGRLRMTISNQERAPDPVVDGKTGTRQGGNQAGLIFFNDKGDECGGLVFGGGGTDGNTHAGAALLFDQYNQDQTIGISYDESNGRRSAAFRVWDRPDKSVGGLIEGLRVIRQMPDGLAKDEAMKKLRQDYFGPARVFVGKTPDRDAQVVLSDPNGKPRITMAVNAAGDPRLDFLDASGKVTYSVPPKDGETK